MDILGCPIKHMKERVNGVGGVRRWLTVVESVSMKARMIDNRGLAGPVLERRLCVYIPIQ